MMDNNSPKLLYEMCCITAVNNKLNLDILPKIIQSDVIIKWYQYMQLDEKELKIIPIHLLNTYILNSDIYNIYNGKKKVNWYKLSVYKLPQDFMELCSMYIIWPYVAEYQILSEDCIIKYTEYVTLNSSDKGNLMLWWRAISRFQKLSEDFMDKYSNKLNWVVMTQYQTLSNNLMVKYFDKLNHVKAPLYQNLSEKLIIDCCDRAIQFFKSHNYRWYNGNDIMVECDILSINNIHDWWGIVSKYQLLSEEFIDNYSGQLNWQYIIQYQSLSNKLIEKYSHLINWSKINVYHNVPLEYIDNNVIDIQGSHFPSNQFLFEQHWRDIFFDQISQDVSLYSYYNKK